MTRGTPRAHLQSLLLATVFLVAPSSRSSTGLLADLISINRTLMEELVVAKRREGSKSEDTKIS